MDTVFKPHLILDYIFTSSNIGVLRLVEIKKVPYTADPITAALSAGLYLSRSNLIQGPPKLGGDQDIHRAADAHFEGRTDITWVRLTVRNSLTNTSISTDIPTLNAAEEEHRAFLEEASKRRAVIANWLDDLVRGV